MVLLSSRTINFLGFIACILLLSFGFYLDWVKNLQPCPLCVLQRIAFALVGLVLLLSCIFRLSKRAIQIYGGLTIFISTIGGWLAAHQVWLQSLPEHERPQMCLPAFNYMVKHFPLDQLIKAMLEGSSNCGVVDWTFLGWSIARWSLVCFIGLGLMGLIQVLRPSSDYR